MGAFEIFILLLFFNLLVFGPICYHMAEARRRNKAAGFGYGSIFGIFAVMGYLMSGDLEKKYGKRSFINMSASEILTPFLSSDKKNIAYGSADEIKKLADLRDQKIITEEEFEAKKKLLLGL